MIAMRKTLGEAPSTQTEHSLGGLTIFLDTAWRVILPVTTLTYFGAALDSKMESAPWFMLLGAMLSVLLATFLVRLQDQQSNE